MSYSQSYHSSVSYSGSVSYPASQNGGSVSYHGSVPIDVTIHVDTAPFDGSINRFNNSVVALGGSVAAMNAAQCIAIKKTADEVSESLINGFFGTIKTELSQQIQALDSAIKAGFGLLQEQGKAVSDKKEVMESDYNRITSRYVKLFTDLDEECYKRIIALDRPSFNISKKVQKELICESSSNAAAMNLLGNDESSSSKLYIYISSLNRKTLDILQTLHSYINQEKNIKALIDSLLSSDEVSENVPLYVPVVFSESEMLENQGTDHNCYIPDFIGQQGKKAVSESINNFCRDISRSKWGKTGETEMEALNREFNFLAEANFAAAEDAAQQRIYKTMLTLWQNTEISSMERSL